MYFGYHNSVPHEKSEAMSSWMKTQSKCCVVCETNTLSAFASWDNFSTSRSLWWMSLWTFCAVLGFQCNATVNSIVALRSFNHPHHHHHPRHLWNHLQHHHPHHQSERTCETREESRFVGELTWHLRLAATSPNNNSCWWWYFVIWRFCLSAP